MKLPSQFYSPCSFIYSYFSHTFRKSLSLFCPIYLSVFFIPLSLFLFRMANSTSKSPFLFVPLRYREVMSPSEMLGPALNDSHLGGTDCISHTCPMHLEWLYYCVTKVTAVGVKEWTQQERELELWVKTPTPPCLPCFGCASWHKRLIFQENVWICLYSLTRIWYEFKLLTLFSYTKLYVQNWFFSTNIITALNNWYLLWLTTSFQSRMLYIVGRDIKCFVDVRKRVSCGLL